ncbi:TPA: sigma-70 family RNA polymerase sigma factor, partial [Streptococcus equi subsp. equi]|nr:sigma-70 family RNA polymerase sigma factor [Streptococcus equi subsp. equi]
MAVKRKYIYVKGQKIYVPDEVYRAYKKGLNHET